MLPLYSEQSKVQGIFICHHEGQRKAAKKLEPEKGFAGKIERLIVYQNGWRLIFFQSTTRLIG